MLIAAFLTVSFSLGCSSVNAQACSYDVGPSLGTVQVHNGNCALTGGTISVGLTAECGAGRSNYCPGFVVITRVWNVTVNGCDFTYPPGYICNHFSPTCGDDTSFDGSQCYVSGNAASDFSLVDQDKFCVTNQLYWGDCPGFEAGTDSSIGPEPGCYYFKATNSGGTWSLTPVMSPC
jgi:hypothetical protein